MGIFLVRFTNSPAKQDIMYAKRRLGKDEKIYINDQLTSLNAMLFKQARDLKRRGHLHSTWTRFGKVFMRKTDQSDAKEIRSPSDL